MKTFLLIAGVVLLVACAVCLLFAVINLFGYYNVLDGSAELYAALHRRSTLFFIIGAVIAAIGIACIVIRFRL